MPSADRVPKASCRLVSDDREDTDDAKECIHHTGGPGVGAEVHPTGDRDPCRNASNIRNGAGPKESRRAI